MADPVHDDETDDAARWWRAYQLAGRARLEEAIDVIRPLADAGDEVAERWLTRWLAAGDLLDELRDLIPAGGGDYALLELSRRLIERDLGPQLRELLKAADADRRQLILDAAVGADPAWMSTLRVLADFGHKASRMHLARTVVQDPLDGPHT